MYVIVDNWAGGCIFFDNESDCKKFVNDWRGSGDYDETNFTIWKVSESNISYTEYMVSPMQLPIEF